MLDLSGPAGQAAYQGVGRVVALALNLFSVGLVIAGLSPAGYGAVTLSFALAYLAGVVAGLGTDTALFRRLSLQPEAREALGAALVLRTSLSAVASVALILGAFVIGPTTDLGSCLLAATVAVLCGPLTASHQVLKSRVRLLPFAVADVAGSALTLGLLLWLHHGGLAPWEATLATTGANLVVWSALAVASFAALRPRFGHLMLETRRLLHEGRPIVGGELVVIGYYRADVLLLGGLASTAAVGLYGAIYKLVDVAMYAQTIVVSAFFPTIARSWSRRGDLASAVGTPARLLLLTGCAGAVVGSIAIPVLLDDLSGGAYGDPSWVVLWLMLTLPFIFLNRLATQTLVAGRRGSAQLLALASGFGGTLVALALIPAFGAAGAALGTLASEISIALVAGAFLRSAKVSFPFVSHLLLLGALAATLLGSLPVVLPVSSLAQWGLTATALVVIAGLALTNLRLDLSRPVPKPDV